MEAKKVIIIAFIAVTLLLAFALLAAFAMSTPASQPILPPVLPPVVAEVDTSTYLENTDANGGGDYKQFMTSTAKDCSSACLSDMACTAWAWATGNHAAPGVRSQCYLKNGSPTMMADANVISGVVTRKKAY